MRPAGLALAHAVAHLDRHCEPAENRCEAPNRLPCARGVPEERHLGGAECRQLIPAQAVEPASDDVDERVEAIKFQAEQAGQYVRAQRVPSALEGLAGDLGARARFSPALIAGLVVRRYEQIVGDGAPRTGPHA